MIYRVNSAVTGYKNSININENNIRAD